MTPQIALTLALLVSSMALLVTEWVPLEVTALLVLGACALTGLVDPAEALAGFSNPAVVTVWAVFILSGGLQRTGVAKILGRHVLRLAGRSETRIAMSLMLSAGLMSAVMNNVAVAALLLPVTMDIARQRGLPPSRLLMPLAFGSLLGGLTTMIGTPPNILVSAALRDAGAAPFRIFDFTPVGLIIMLAGTTFVATIGRRILPSRDVAGETTSGDRRDLQREYDLKSRMFQLRVLRRSALAGKTLSESRLGTLLGLQIVGITRAGKTSLAPPSGSVLQPEDLLLVKGRLERFDSVSGWRELEDTGRPVRWEEITGGDVVLAEGRLAKGTPLENRTLRELDVRSRFGLNVLIIRRGGVLQEIGPEDLPLLAGDFLMLQGTSSRLDSFAAAGQIGDLHRVTEGAVAEAYRLPDRLCLLRLRHGSRLIGQTLAGSKLGGALGAHVLGLLRRSGKVLMPGPDEVLDADDLLIVAARRDDLETARALDGLEIERELPPETSELESERVGLVEAILSPRSTMAGRTPRQLGLRDKYGLSVLAIWRGGRAYRTNVRDMALSFGDALLMYGPRQRLTLLARDPDLVVLTESAQQFPLAEKAVMSLLIMAAVIAPVILGLVPIYIAAVVGAALMVLSGCLTMEEAYRSIDWRSVFLIAGMMSLGVALDRTGAAQWIAQGVVSGMGPLGPRAVMLGLVLVTFLATCVVPTAALVVLMSPIILNAAADMSVSPQSLMMAMAMAASSSFMTPISHPANLMVMGPGGYRFVDYVRLGTPLTLVVLVVILVAVPAFWPL